MKKTISILLLLAMLCCGVSAFAAPAKQFTDVSSSSWYASYVDFVVENGLFNGTSATAFSPAQNMTRGMFVTALGRYAKVSYTAEGAGVLTATDVNLRSEPNTSSQVLTLLKRGAKFTVIGKTSNWFHVRYDNYTGYIRDDLMTAHDKVFSDVPYGTYYSNYVQWAYKTGIINGTSSSAFSPNQPITREQMCVILNKYAQYAKLTLPKDQSNTSFSDQNAISSWAASSVSVMSSAGVITGSGGKFNPTQNASRAEVATIFARFDSAVKTAVSPSPSPSPDPTPTPEIIDTDEGMGTYQYELFGNIPPAGAAVSDTFFDDACFIGHSIVVGMKSAFNLPKASFYAVNGGTSTSLLSYDQFSYVGDYIDEEGNPQHGETTGTLENALKNSTYKKVYIMLGINEVGSSLNTYYNNMSKIVDLVHSTQPNAAIYLLSITPLTTKYTAYGSNFEIENLLKFNNVLQTLSLNKDIYYIDLFTPLANKEGHLPSKYTWDGLHLYASGQQLIKAQLKTHTGK